MVAAKAVKFVFLSSILAVTQPASAEGGGERVKEYFDNMEFNLGLKKKEEESVSIDKNDKDKSLSVDTDS